MNDPSRKPAEDSPSAEELAEQESSRAEPTEDAVTESPPLESDSEAQDHNDAGELGALIDRSPYQGLPGAPTTAIPGKKYYCDAPGCTHVRFKRGLGSPPLCEQHGQVMKPVPDAG